MNRNRSTIIIAVLLFIFFFNPSNAQTISCIRINQLGYPVNGIKVAVWGSDEPITDSIFTIINATDNSIVFRGKTGKDFGEYGPFTHTSRLNFSALNKKGKYIIELNVTKSPVFTIDDAVYDGAADFCLRYMRQQRSGFNPFLKDSCHTHDGYTLYAPVPDSTYINVVGGWHDATDYLQYSTTSANATYHLLAAYRDFPGVFTDVKQSNG